MWFSSVIPTRTCAASITSDSAPCSPGDQFEIAIEQTEGILFRPIARNLHSRCQSAFEHGREIGVADVIEAIELQAAGAQDLKTSVGAWGFVRHPEGSPSRK